MTWGEQKVPGFWPIPIWKGLFFHGQVVHTCRGWALFGFAQNQSFRKKRISAIIFRSQLGVHPICTTNVKNLTFLRSFEKVGPPADLSASFRVAGDGVLHCSVLFFWAVQIIRLRSPNQDVVLKMPFVDTPQAYTLWWTNIAMENHHS